MYFNKIELYTQNEDTGLSSIVNTIESVYPLSRKERKGISHYLIQSDSQHFFVKVESAHKRATHLISYDLFSNHLEARAKSI
jgi:hypothetical protein